VSALLTSFYAIEKNRSGQYSLIAAWTIVVIVIYCCNKKKEERIVII